ncbi:MAG: D-alanyl-D-alanine carboxypeptidase/D-alanyl-D-alanine-endopeptidase [Proteobacteria bacterium]|nr:D-alanyl-D-alanine carboxypeptidase/D-alanyl-D-alanine-endopeptidase [Pseudomonadota bacterium]
MNKALNVWLAASLLFFCLPTLAGDLPGPIRKLMRDYRIPQKSVSIYVHRIGDEEPQLQWLENKPRNPASTIKLLTTFAALELLGPAYSWKTEVYVDSPPSNSVLNGDLYLKGYGDPYLVSEQFWRLLREVRHRGLKNIKGDLVLDDSYFAPDKIDTSEFDGRPHRAYNVSPSAFLLNFQSVNFLFRPSDTGKSINVVADPDPGIRIKNKLRPVAGRCRNWKRRMRMDIAESESVSFSGRYARECGDKNMYRVVADADRYVYGVFNSYWKELGGSFTGKLNKAVVPESASLFYQKHSQPLPDIIRAINKYSNNVMTRQLLLTLAAEHAGLPGTTENGVAVIKDWLQQRELSDPGLVLDNGAGLSRDTRISASHLGRILMAAFHSPRMPELMASLPITGTDGTMARRFTDSPLTGRVHVKTGLLDNVRGLAGYVLDQQQHRWVVVILHNHSGAPFRAGEQLQGAVLDWVLNQSDG